MPDPRRGQPPPSEIDATSRELIDAQEPQSPATVAEMRDATKHAFDSAIRTLGNTASLEEWVAATNDLEAAFFEANGGALAEQIRLALGKDTLDAAEWAAAEELVRQTADIASRIYQIIHRLQTLGFASTREEIVRKLEVGDLSATIKVHNVSIVPRRRTLIGLLRDLDAKVGVNVWSLEFPPEIPAKIVLADPFDEGTEGTAKLWRHRIVAKNAVEPGVVHSIYTISGDITATVAYELGTVGDRTKDLKLKEATATIVAWLDRKSVYYQDPDKRDFALYHLGMEQPQDLMNIFRSLDRIKHADPELFLELVGINPDGGGKSPYFGSFLHKALFNTQKAVDRASGLGEMAIRTMLKQLLTLDATVSTYSGVVSKEAMDAMGAQIKERVATQSTDADKALALIMMAVPYSQVVVDAEIRRQLEELRGINLEKIKEALDYRIADIEHPMKLLEYLKWVPRAMFSDDDVCRKIRKALNVSIETVATPDALYSWVHEKLDLGQIPIFAPLYQRIPLLDESRADLGFGRRMVVAARDALTFDNSSAFSGIQDHYTRTDDVSRKIFYDFVGPTTVDLLCRPETINVISSQLSLKGRQLLRSIHEKPAGNRNTIGGSKAFDYFVDPELLKVADPFVLGQLIVINTGPGKLANVEQALFAALERIPNPDLVLLSVLANPNGAAVAFEHFDKFCARIETERMYQILRDHIPNAPQHPAIEKFNELFHNQLPEHHTVSYVKHLRREILGMWGFDQYHQPYVDLHLKLNRVLVDKKTPWTVVIDGSEIDADGNYDDGYADFELWRTFEHSNSALSSGFGGHVRPIPNPDQIEWGKREQDFVKENLRKHNVHSFLRSTDLHGIELVMYRPNNGNIAIKLMREEHPPNGTSLRGDLRGNPQFPILQLNLKSRPS